MVKKINRQTIQDKIICSFNNVRYHLTEPIALRIARLRNESSYYNQAQKNPLISVYIPTYNRCQLLMERAVTSVLKQIYKNWELIIIGDHCTDETEKNILKINDKRIKFYNLPYRKYRYPPTAENHWLTGPVVPANKALSLVKGRWIARIDDDDIWTPDHLKVLLRFAQKNNYEFVSAAYIAERYGKKVLVNVKDEQPRIGGTQTWLYRSYLKFFKYNINCWRKKWNRVNDTDLQDRMIKAGVRMGFLDKVVAHIFPRPNEKTIGLDAYKDDISGKISHFKFK